MVKFQLVGDFTKPSVAIVNDAEAVWSPEAKAFVPAPVAAPGQSTSPPPADLRMPLVQHWHPHLATVYVFTNPDIPAPVPGNSYTGYIFADGADQPYDAVAIRKGEYAGTDRLTIINNF